MAKELLVEIGVEELPAIPFLKELKNIEKKWKSALEQEGLFSEFEFFYTPRRVIFFHKNFLDKQPDREVELFGPPVLAAFKDGVPTQAGNGFAKKCGVALDKLQRCEKNGKEVLYFKEITAGKSSKELLAGIIENFLKSLNFGKTMRWGEQSEEFIRPIRWFIVKLHEEFLDFSLFGAKASNKTYIHRSISYDGIEVSSSSNFFESLEKNGVIYSQQKREKIILDGFKNIEESNGVKIEQDSELLAEIVAITEYPTPLLGSFEEKFLTLPKEVVITSMKEHQRYFGVLKSGSLFNGFLVVSNAYTSDFSKVIKGNEKVLKARLEDALFFYNNDIKNGLNSDGLKNIAFMQGLGFLSDKKDREIAIGEILFAQNRESILEDGGSIDSLKEALELSKADLLSEMVYEFTELQGLMGYYYSKIEGKDELISLAIKEQYLPNSQDGELPSRFFSAIVAMCSKIDSILAIFSVDKIPSGSKDPFALRRAAIGVLKIVLEFNIKFDFKDGFSTFNSLYEKIDTNALEKFFTERLEAIFDVNPSIIASVLASGDREILSVASKIEALSTLSQEKSFKENFSTFKRVVNITKDMNLKSELKIDATLFNHDAEKALFDAFLEVKNREFKNYYEKLSALFSLKSVLDSFFDSVMVNDENAEIRENRKNLIGSINREFLSIADIKEIAI